MVSLGQGRVIEYRERTVQELIEDQVRAGSGRVAIECTGTTLSYLDLWVAAVRVRDFLLQAGVRPGTPVGVAMERSRWLVPVLLGIWLARGGYVPIDEKMPSQRRQRIIDEVASHGMRWILVDHHAAASSMGLRPRCLIEFDGMSQSVLVCEIEAWDPERSDIGLENLAYVMYTSGSTGQPKGTIITSKNFSSFLNAIDSALGADPDEVTIATTPLTFDIAGLELFWPLACGRRLVLLDSIGNADPGTLAKVLRRPGPKLLQVTPSTSSLVDFPDKPNQLRLLVGGEALPRQTAERLLGRCDTLHNLYGPTETTVWVTQHEVTDATGNAVVPIGRPLPNCGVVVLDSDQRPVPVGIEGELYVYGPQVSSGYLNAGTVQSEAFLIDNKESRAVYRTGDRVTWSADGTLSFLGRADNQVKIAGNRVELGEIEAALRSHAKIRDAAVIFDHDGVPPRVRAFIQPMNSADATFRASEDALVAAWVNVFDQHLESDQAARDRLPVSIWRNSVDGSEFSRAEMQEWLEAVACIVLESGNRRILDIGCGTGSLLTEIEPHIDCYIGVEPSATAVATLRETFSSLTRKASFIHASARDVGLATIISHIRRVKGADADCRLPDCVVLNSVIQYFPSKSYLDEVLDQAFGLLEPGGRLLVADVRNAALLDRLDDWRQESRGSAAGLPPSADNELCLDPRYFYEWACRQGCQPAIWISPKFLQHRNELSMFRYDVEIIKATSFKAENYEVVSYSKIPEGLEGLMNLFGEVPVALIGIPDSRLSARSFPAETTPVRLRTLLAGEVGARIGLDPFDPDQGALMVAYHPNGKPHWGDIAATARTSGMRNTEPRLDPGIHPLADIWEHLAQLLPAHMVPASIRILPRLPLTSSGKVARAMLLAASADSIEIPAKPGRAYADPPSEILPGPAAEITGTLIDIASELLDGSLGPDDDLVQAGVTSLDAVRIAGAAWQRLGWRVGAGEFLRLRSLRSIAAHLAGGGRGLSDTGHARTVGSDMSLAQRAMLTMSYLDPGNAKMNILMRWRLAGNFDEQRIRAAINAVVRHHPVLRTLYPPVADPVVLAAGQEQDLIVVVSGSHQAGAASPLELAEMPFDLEHEPPVRWLLEYSEPGPSSLYAILHHVSVDDAALSVLHEALVSAYAGIPPSVEPTAARYSAVFAAERRLLADRLEADRDFWRGRRGSFDGSAAFPVGDRLPTAARALRQAGSWPGGAVAIRHAARQMDVTAYSLFLAAASSAIARALAGSSVLVGVPVSSREAVGGDELLGCFANLVPLLIHDHGDDSARTIRESHAAVLSGLDHGLLPFAEIARLAELPQRSDGDRMPSFVCQLAAAPQPATAFDVLFSPSIEQPTYASYPVVVRGETSDGDLTVFLDYDRAVIDEQRARHLVQSLIATLTQFSSASRDLA